MPASRLTFDAAPAKIVFDGTGNLVSVTHSQRPGLEYLTAPPSCRGRVGLEPLSWRLVDRLVDSDELELIMVCDGPPIRFVLRHMFSSGWGVRLAWTNQGVEPVRIDNLVWPITVGAGCVGWGLAAGAEAGYAVLPRDGDGPLLGGRLRLGAVAEVGPDGLLLGSIELSPGGRYVLQWEWDWYPTPAAYGLGRHPSVPWAQAVLVDEVTTLFAGADVALMAPEGVSVELTGERYELAAGVPGRYPLQLRSATGITSFNLTWVVPTDELLAGAGQRALEARRTRAGVVRLVNLSQALVVQHVLGAGSCDEPEVAEDALEFFTARLLDQELVGRAFEQGSPLAAAFLCREYERSGDPDLLDEAVRVLLDQPAPRPGIGVAGARMCLALLAAGQPPGRVVSHLVELARQVPNVAASHNLPIEDQIAALELLAVTGASPDAEAGGTGGPSAAEDVRRRVLALGVHLGAGLKGAAVSPIGPDALALLLAVFRLLPERLSGEVLPEWGWSVQDLVRRAAAGLVANLGEETQDPTPVGPAHAWLALASGVP